MKYSFQLRAFIFAAFVAVGAIACSSGSSNDCAGIVQPKRVLTVSPDSVVLDAGSSAAISASVGGGCPSDNNTVTFSAQDGSIASVSASGSVSALAGGRTTVTVTAPGLTRSVIIVVRALVASSIDARPASDTLSPTATVALSATIRDQNMNLLPAAPVTWRSVTPSVATVVASGLLTAVGVGEALIVASTPRAAGADSLRDTVSVLVVAPCNLIRSILFGASYSGSFGTYTCRNQPFPLMDQFSLTATVQRSYAIRFRPTFVASLVQLNVGNGLYGMPPSDTAVVGFGVIRAGTFGFMVASPTSGTVGTYSFTVDSNPDPRLSCVLTDVTRGVAFDTALYPSGCPSRTVRVLPALDVGARINVTALAQNFPVRIELREDGTENVLATSVAATSGGTASISYTTTTFRFVHVFVAGTNGTVRLTID